MKRDLDLIRLILLNVEENLSSSMKKLDSRKMLIDGYTTNQIIFHLELLRDRNYVEIEDPFTCYGAEYRHYFIIRMTDTAFDFLDNTRDEKIWKNIKRDISTKVTSASLDIIMLLAKSKISQVLNIER